MRDVNEECAINIELQDWLGVVDLLLEDKKGKVQYHYIIFDYFVID